MIPAGPDVDVNHHKGREMSVIEKNEPMTQITRDSRYSVGTLTYTKFSLFSLFAWLLWGDYCFMMMETIVPAIVPLKLRHLDAPNWIIALIISTIPGVLNMTVCPWVSYKSDRHRGPRGRRIPFILWTLPFLSIFLLLLGFSQQIGHFLHGLLPADTSFSPTTMTITCIAVFMIGFQFFNMFVNSVFWYLFNDVVPAAFIGRFLGMFRIVTGIQSAVFNFLVFKYAESHMTEIFVATTILYAVGFGLMCLKIKEGQYPPPPETVDGKSGFASELKTYIVECYSQRYYWNLFLYTTCLAIASTIGVFVVFQYQSIGLNLQQIGIMAGISNIANIMLTYPAGVLADRFHPIRVLRWSQLFNLCMTPLPLIWLFMDANPTVAFYISLAIALLIRPVAVVNEAMVLPMYMRVLPKDRYGQFCSAMALVRSCGTIFGGLLAGIYIDITVSWYPNSMYGYRFESFWIIVWTSLAYFFLMQLYKEWNAKEKLAAAVNT